MMRFVQGNLLDAKVEALVNTVNTVGVMGKGIALMFKEAFPDNFRSYEDARKRKEVRIGQMFVTERRAFEGPHWIINFPTKKHWRQPSKMEWIVEALQDLRRFIAEHNIQSIALPPLGAGYGQLDWSKVRAEIQHALADLEGVDVVVYEPTEKYQTVTKRTGVEELTPQDALSSFLHLPPLSSLSCDGHRIQQRPPALAFTIAAAADAALWMITTGSAVAFILKGKVPEHRQWMTRSFAVSLVFLEVRVIGGLGGWEDLDVHVNETLVWFCLAFAILLADLLLQWQQAGRSTSVVRPHSLAT
jgi:O-acetyl-ADP-ribose deacetylase (regulator of RNase III)